MPIIALIFCILLGSIAGCFLAKLTLYSLGSQTVATASFSKIFLRYLLIVNITSILFIICWIFLPLQKAILGMIFVSYLICVAIVDIEQLRIPNSLNLCGFLIAVLFSIFFPSWHNVTGNLPILSGLESIFSALAGSFIGSGCLLWIAILAEAVTSRESIGMGDVKLMGVLGAFCGWKGAVFAIFGGSLIASFFILSYQFIIHLFKRRATLNERIPFGFWLSLASFLYFTWFEQSFEEYLQVIDFLMLNGF